VGEAGGGAALLAFISYARADLAMVERLRDGLALVGCQVWMDLQAGGGREWWVAILEQVRGCDLFIAVLSPAGLESLACTREREYATALGKPVLPVRVAPVSARILPPAVARVNIIDYTQPDTFQTGVHLALAVARMPAPPPLPDPLPPEPMIPLSYLAELGERVHAPHLTFEEQMAVTAMLRDALTRPVDHDDARTLAEAFAHRDDLYYRAHQQVQDVLTGAPRPGRTAHRQAGPPRESPFPAATAQTLRTLSGHQGAVNGVAFAPDGTLLATASSDKTARLWNPATGEHVRTFQGHTEGVYGVAFSPDGTLLATASGDDTARLWNPATGEHLRTLQGHTEAVWDVAFSPDGTLLATVSHEGALLWNAATGEHLRTLQGHTGAFWAVAFSPDGTLLATASNDNTARLWNAATGEHLRTLEGHTQALIEVAFSPDGTLLATASGDQTARLWNPATGEHLRTLSGHTGSVLGVAFSPDGTLLATGGDDTARMWG
jgi:sugar lactone lactonase YvrE